MDIRVVDGIGMSSRLNMLASSFRSLASGRIPPGTVESEYSARANTLASFAEQASDEYSSRLYMAGFARYSVVRSESVPLLAMINNGLGTAYALP